MRLIDADAAIRLLKSIGSRDYRREKGTIADAIKMLSHSAYTPTIEAEPVKHGRWGWYDLTISFSYINRGYMCSVCGFKQEDETIYCPNCGCKMDLEEA